MEITRVAKNKVKKSKRWPLWGDSDSLGLQWTRGAARSRSFLLRTVC